MCTQCKSQVLVLYVNACIYMCVHVQHVQHVHVQCTCTCCTCISYFCMGSPIHLIIGNDHNNIIIVSSVSVDASKNSSFLLIRDPLLNDQD